MSMESTRSESENGGGGGEKAHTSKTNTSHSTVTRQFGMKAESRKTVKAVTLDKFSRYVWNEFFFGT